MKIVWVAHPQEAEADIEASAAKHDDLDLQIVSVTDPANGAKGVRETGRFTRDGVLQTLRGVAEAKPDLVVLRYPYWIAEFNVFAECQNILRNTSIVAWTSEQGPTRESALNAALKWKHVAVNCVEDIDWYKQRLPKAEIHYLPFGCAPNGFAKRRKFATDLVADGVCHFACNEYGRFKSHSVATMVMPVLDQDIALYGPENRSLCGWMSVPGAARRYRGFYPSDKYHDVYATTKMYIGISHNWFHGGYGTKLSRVLSTGIPVIWHRTKGAIKDGLMEGLQLDFSGSPGETREKVLWYLAHDREREAMGQRGRLWAEERWDWGTNLKRLAREVSR